MGIDFNEHQRRQEKALRARTGRVNDARPLVAFINALLRGGTVSPAGMDDLVNRATCDRSDGIPTQYVNGHLARYAQDIADRLTKVAEEERPPPTKLPGTLDNTTDGRRADVIA